MKIFNYNIDIKSIFEKGCKPINEEFGISLITGYQGTGKTFLAIYLLDYLPKNKIYTNIKSLKIPNREIIYFENLDEITSNIEKNCIFIIDEISKRFPKECKQDVKFYSWLQQSRKRERIVLLITQEYLQVPFWLRGIARFVYTTSKFPFFPIFKTEKGRAVLLEDTKEWAVEPYITYIYKRTKKICSYYDTMEPINIL